MPASPNPGSSLPDNALAKAEFQRVVFAERPRRGDLMRAARPFLDAARPVRLTVHRNQPFEFIASLLSPFLAFSGRSADCTFSDYDDSLSFGSDAGTDADIELVWLDFDRYTAPAGDVIDWLMGRLETLRDRSRAPILVAPSPGQDEAARRFNQLLRERCKILPGVRVPPLDDIAAALGADYLDNRMADIGATRLSERANVEIARHMGLSWLPGVLEPRLKAVVFDLDNTLWGGVLGEDGPLGLSVDGPFAALQTKAADLADSGLFIGLLSRNEPADVAAMFDTGRLALPPAKIAARSISWDAKADGLRHIAEALRIGLDAILYVDDNPGELAAIAASCPGVRLLHAGPDGAETLRGLSLYPGLFSWGSDATDALRAADLATNEARAALRTGSVSAEDYLASLKLVLRVAADPEAQRERLQQLSVKTNQFNLALRRLSAVDVAEALADPERAAVAMWLSDRFSDSGLIGALFARQEAPGTVVVEELCISCRALGRGIDDAMVISAINAAVAAIGAATGRLAAEVAFDYDNGPRNGPARDWLARFARAELSERGRVTLQWDARERGMAVAALPIELVQGAPDGC